LETALDLERYTAIQQQKMEQMTELLKAMEERMETQIGSLACKMDANQAKLKGMQQKIDGGQEQMITKMDVWLAEMRA
jgi:chaperonin cofactor prefoldin